MRKNINNFNAELVPLNCHFNMYYKAFLVTTKVDMRVFDALTGKLIKVFTNLSDEKLPCEMTDICLGSRERKMIVSDNGGLVRIMNVNNGECMQKLVKLKELKDRQNGIGKFGNIRDTISKRVVEDKQLKTEESAKHKHLTDIKSAKSIDTSSYV
jgi:hypothetical protein